MKRSSTILIAVIVILVVGLGVLSVLLSRVPAKTYQAKETDPEANWATLTGSLSYPSESLPKLGVCAQTPDLSELYCTYEILSGESYLYNYGYSLKVPPGKYYVFSHLVDETKANIGYIDQAKAYYSNFVVCGLSAECADHTPVLIQANAREETTLVDPVDWYNLNI
jgi:hypothetical protein